MGTRTVMATIEAHHQTEGAGFEVRRPFPTPRLSQLDPFLLLDEMGPVELEPGAAKGAPDHPHRGFETVTYMISGATEHEDSAGHAGRIGPGGVQWMTAGSGVIHSEMPARELFTDGGRMHGFQLWVNLPQADKMSAPQYQEFRADEIPAVTESGAVVRVIAGCTPTSPVPWSRIPRSATSTSPSSPARQSRSRCRATTLPSRTRSEVSATGHCGSSRRTGTRSGSTTRVRRSGSISSSPASHCASRWLGTARSS